MAFDSPPNTFCLYLKPVSSAKLSGLKKVVAFNVSFGVEHIFRWVPVKRPGVLGAMMVGPPGAAESSPKLTKIELTSSNSAKVDQD